MTGWLEFVEQDVLVIFYGLEGRDLAIPLSCLAILLLFMIPLKNIDRQDLLCGLMYVVYIIAGGTMLFFAVPGVEDGLTAIGLHLAFACLLGAAAAYRWFHTTNDFVINRHNENHAPVDKQEPIHEKV